MDNERRMEIYSRDRGSLTPTQARRARHKANQEAATISHRTRRAARRDVLRFERLRRLQIRSLFRRA